MNAIFPGFLDDLEDYAACERYWADLVNSTALTWNQGGDWIRWISPWWENGIMVRDGNPIYDGFSKVLNRAFRIIQHRYYNEETAISAWVNDSIEYPEMPNYELLFSLSLTDETSKLAASALSFWMNPETTKETMEHFIDEHFPKWADTN